MLLSTTPGFAEPVIPEIGTEVWQKQYYPNPAENYYRHGVFLTVGFNTDGSVLTNGYRNESHSASAIGIRYNSETGALVDALPTPPEWFLFEYTTDDLAQDRFYDQYIDSSGNVYFVGMSYPAEWNSGSALYNVPNVWKYSSDYDNPHPGNPDDPDWKNYYVRSGTAAEENGNYEAMAVDSAGYIYAVGSYLNLASMDPVSGRDWIIDKFDSSSDDGSRVDGFPKSYNGDNLGDYAYDVATDSEDNFVVVGSTVVDAATDHHDWVVRKYASDGSLLWATQSDLSTGNDQAFSVAVDGNDNIIVVGYRRNALPAGDNDWYIVKYAKDGDGNGGATVIWEKSWDNGSSQHGEARDVLLDHRGFIFIVGNQRKNSVSPAYTDRNRPVLQYRHPGTGELVAMQEFVLDNTVNDEKATEHDYIRSLSLNGDQLVIGGYTQQDGAWGLTHRLTARVLMLKIKIWPMFSDGFE